MWPRWVLLAILMATADPRPAAVATRMRHLLLHLGRGVDLRVDDLSGRLVSRTAGPPVFDDVNSYVVELDAARVGMTAESLTNLMNGYVFAGKDAPISDLRITIEGNELKQTGKLRKGIAVPFTMRGSIAATADGKIRIHPTSIKAAGFLSKRVLDFFGLELERLVKTTSTPAVTIDGDDLLLDPERLLPPPAIRGRLTKVWIENGVVIEQFGTGTSRTAIAPPDRRFTNYMYYRGGRLRFGKLTMDDTDLLLVDADPKDPFDFSPAGYERQLVAGYSKNTPAHGLIVHMPDFNDLGGVGAPRHQRADGQPRERQHYQ
jgi:hypothetical protein